MLLGSKKYFAINHYRIAPCYALSQSSKKNHTRSVFLRKTGYVFIFLRVPNAKLGLQASLHPIFDVFALGIVKLTPFVYCLHTFCTQRRSILAHSYRRMSA